MGLLLKLVEHRVPLWCTRWIGNWLSNRSFRVALGLPQESPLSPRLFNVFVGDLSLSLKFADDSTVGKLELAARKLVNFFSNLKMLVNERDRGNVCRKKVNQTG